MMDQKNTNFNATVLFIFPLIVLFSTYLVVPNQLIAQNRPLIFSQDPDSDDIKLCTQNSSKPNPLVQSEYCDLFTKYSNSEDTNKVLAATYRNKMIESVAEQVDTFYDNVVNKRKNNNKWFQTLFDILEIGAAVAINITNGERAKSIIASGLAGTQTGRISVNKNFELLQTQILINQMNANRDEKLLEIITSKRLDIDQYSWKEAKRNLRDYLVRGTFNGALNSLVQQTGSQATTAKNNLANILQNPPQSAFANSVQNFDYIRQIKLKAEKIQSDLIPVNAGLVAMPGNLALTKQKADLITQQNNLLANYKNIMQEIVNHAEFQKIDDKVKAKYTAPPPNAVIVAYDGILAKFKATPAMVTDVEYDTFLTKINKVVSGDDSLNQLFLTILGKYKI